MIHLKVVLLPFRTGPHSGVPLELSDQGTGNAHVAAGITLLITPSVSIAGQIRAKLPRILKQISRLKESPEGTGPTLTARTLRTGLTGTSL